MIETTDSRQETCVPRSAGAWNLHRDGKQTAIHLVNGAVMEAPILIVAGNRGYRSPNVPGWVGHMGNVDSEHNTKEEALHGCGATPTYVV
jgi:hypothetical protein